MGRRAASAKSSPCAEARTATPHRAASRTASTSRAWPSSSVTITAGDSARRAGACLPPWGSRPAHPCWAPRPASARRAGRRPARTSRPRPPPARRPGTADAPRRAAAWSCRLRAGKAAAPSAGVPAEAQLRHQPVRRSRNGPRQPDGQRSDVLQCVQPAFAQHRAAAQSGAKPARKRDEPFRSSARRVCAACARASRRPWRRYLPRRRAARPAAASPRRPAGTADGRAQAELRSPRGLFRRRRLQGRALPPASGTGKARRASHSNSNTPIARQVCASTQSPGGSPASAFHCASAADMPAPYMPSSAPR